jgi:hypothetical protein
MNRNVLVFYIANCRVQGNYLIAKQKFVEIFTQPLDEGPEANKFLHLKATFHSLHYALV